VWLKHSSRGAMLAFQLVAEALGVSEQRGKSAWDAAKARLKRRGLSLPETTHVEVPGRRKTTPQLKAEDAARALRLVLADPSVVFGNDAKLQWLRAKVLEAGGDPATVDAEVEALRSEKWRRDEDAQSLALPGLTGLSAATLRCIREDGEVLGSVHDYLKWLGLEDTRHEWNNWLREEFRASLNPDSPDAVSEVVRVVEKRLPGDFNSIPFTNFAGYRILTKLCLRKSKIAQTIFDEAQKALGRVAVGDQRLHAEIDANAAASSEPAREFVLGAGEAKRQRRSSAAEVDDLAKEALRDDAVSLETTELRLEKVALARYIQEKAKAETKAMLATKEAETKVVLAAKEAEYYKIQAEHDRIQAERDLAKVQSSLEIAKADAALRAVEDDARDAAEERERRRTHTAELEAEKRRAEIKKAAAAGAIDHEAAAAMLAEDRRTPIPRLEAWLQRACRCPKPSSCSSTVSRLFNEAVAAGRHAKPRSHFDGDTQRWRLFEEQDGAALREIHQGFHDARNGITPGQTRLV
jgi:hypothetical protein